MSCHHGCHLRKSYRHGWERKNGLRKSYRYGWEWNDCRCRKSYLHGWEWSGRE